MMIFCQKSTDIRFSFPIELALFIEKLILHLKGKAIGLPFSLRLACTFEMLIFAKR